MDVLIPAWYYGMAVLTAEADFDPAGLFPPDGGARGDPRLSSRPPL